MRKAAVVCLTAILIPYIATLTWTGRVEGNTRMTARTGKTIILDRGSSGTFVDLEEYLIGVTAVQIPASYEKEAIKAQAVIARTYLYQQMDGNDSVPESSLDLDYLEQGQMEALWGENAYLDNYKKIRDAVQETSGQILQYNGSYIEPLFHRMSAGRTRAGDSLHPYLVPVDEPENLEGENYISVITMTREEMASKLNAMQDSPGVKPEEVLESIQMIKKDEAGYVEAIQVGSKSYEGGEVQYAMGLPSPAYSFENYEGSIRCTTRGIGHGYGLDQYGASRKAEQGWTAEDILKYYYKNIVVVSE